MRELSTSDRGLLSKRLYHGEEGENREGGEGEGKWLRVSCLVLIVDIILL